MIDALDECEKGVCAEVLSIIRELQIHTSVGLLGTTRPLREVLDYVPSRAVLEVRASESDVALYLRARVHTLPKFVQIDQALQEEIMLTIVSAVDEM